MADAHVIRRNWANVTVSLQPVLKEVSKRFGAFIALAASVGRRAEQMQLQVDKIKDSFEVSRARENAANGW